MNRRLGFKGGQAAAWSTLARRGAFQPERMARLAVVGLPHLRRLCRQFWGEPLESWLRGQQVIAARWLLAEGWSVKDTAKAVGFRYATHFARVFRQAHGVTPGRFARFRRPGPGTGQGCGPETPNVRLV